MQSFNAVFVRIQDGTVCAYGRTKPFDKPFVFWMPLGGVPVSAWESHLVGVSKVLAAAEYTLNSLCAKGSGKSC